MCLKFWKISSFKVAQKQFDLHIITQFFSPLWLLMIIVDCMTKLWNTFSLIQLWLPKAYHSLPTINNLLAKISLFYLFLKFVCVFWWQIFIFKSTDSFSSLWRYFWPIEKFIFWLELNTMRHVTILPANHFALRNHGKLSVWFLTLIFYSAIKRPAILTPDCRSNYVNLMNAGHFRGVE